MNNLKLYTVFHGNLQFSSIPKSDCAKVINRCYWPLVNLVDKLPGLRIGIEFSGETLLEINRIDRRLISKIKSLINKEKIEFIGSGYTQAIFPLIPYEINRLNLRLGMKTYSKILGFMPKIFYANEQTISWGIFDAYCDEDIRAVIVDFDSTPDKVRLKSELLYQSSIANNLSEEKFRIIWSSTIAFQKFQRFIFDEISQDDYLKYLKGHASDVPRFFPLYCGDWELFGYSPKGIERNVENDFPRIKFLLNLLSNKNFDFVLPSQVLKKKSEEKPIKILNSATPISSRKQLKYNVSRWAVAGKYSTLRNTFCYKIYNQLSKMREVSGVIGENVKLDSLYKELVSLWGSDFRTNTSADKNIDFSKRSEKLAREIDYKLKVLIKKYTKGKFLIINTSDKHRDEIVSAKLKNPKAFQYEIRVNGEKTVCQLVPTVFDRKGKILEADLIFGASLAPGQIGEVEIKPISGKWHFTSSLDSIKTKSVHLTLDRRTGGTMRNVAFVNLVDKALFGLVYHGWYKDPELSVDWFSGHCLFEDDYLKKHTDLNRVNIRTLPGKNPIMIPIFIENETDVCKILKIYYVYKNIPRVDLQYFFEFKRVGLKSARIANVTLNPEIFDLKKLAYWTNNGGENIEKFSLSNINLNFCQLHSLRITTRGCLGSTNNWLGITDFKKALLMVWDKSNLAACPLLHFQKTPQGLYGRIQFSIGESDETGYSTFDGKYSFKMSFMGMNHKLFSESVSNLKNGISLFQ